MLPCLYHYAHKRLHDGGILGIRSPLEGLSDYNHDMLRMKRLGSLHGLRTLCNKEILNEPDQDFNKKSFTLIHSYTLANHASCMLAVYNMFT